MVILHTNHGKITLELDQARAPKTVANFLDYVRAGHFGNTLFHRVIDGFMIQGGGMTPDFRQKPIFINVSDNDFLDHRSPDANGWGYCVFGRVIAGADVVDRIKALPTGNRAMHQNVPKDDVVIERAEVTE